MPTYRFQMVEPRLLRDVGIPTLALWAVVFAQLMYMGARGRLDAFVMYHGALHFSWSVYVAAFAGGLTLVWLWLLQGTRSFVTVAPEGLSVQQYGLTLWTLPWKEFVTWDWEHDVLGQPYSIVIHTRGWQNRHVRLGVLYAGPRKGGKVYPNPEYRALLEAISHYVPTKGAGWSRTVPWA
ncbi:MAG: hypothetical protein ABFE07_10680 [Armatimonadia bacterium]